MEQKDEIRLRFYQCKSLDDLSLEDLLEYAALQIDSIDEILSAIRRNYPGNPLILKMLTDRAVRENLADHEN